MYIDYIYDDPQDTLVYKNYEEMLLIEIVEEIEKKEQSASDAALKAEIKAMKAKLKNDFNFYSFSKSAKPKTMLKG